MGSSASAVDVRRQLPRTRTLAAVARLLIGATAASLVAVSLAAQAPLLGPDSGSFRHTFEQVSTTNAAGTSMEVSLSLSMLTTTRVTAVGGDTLRVHTTLDSIAISQKAPGTELSVLDVSLMPMKKGDTSVFLMSRRGAVLKQLSGIEALSHSYSPAGEFPEDLKPGMSWPVPPMLQQLPGTDADPMLQAMASAMSKALEGASRTTYTGIVDRGGVQAWRFDTDGSASNKPLSLPGLPGDMSIKDMKASGSTFVDTRGRILHVESNSAVTMEIMVQGMAMSTTSTTKMSSERIR